MEHDQLASRHEQLLLESEESKETFQRQMRTEEARHSTQRQEQSEMISQLRQEVEDVTNAFKNQLHSLQDDHHKVGRVMLQRFTSSFSLVPRPFYYINFAIISS